MKDDMTKPAPKTSLAIALADYRAAGRKGKKLSAHAFDPLADFPPEVSEYLTRFAAGHCAAEVMGWLEGARRLKVLVVGETIVDEYHYCETLGKSGKEPILATRFLHSERFAGGILAVANNVAAFCDQVTVLSVLGRQNGQPDPTEPFIRQNLDAQVASVFVYQEDAPTILKRRFVEAYPLQKLFEVYMLKHMEENGPEAQALCARLEALVPLADVVIVTDYGHGMLGPRAIDILTTHSKFLAVNTQSNAGNNGFNAISKYPRADYVCLAHREFALETRNRHMSPEEMVLHVSGKLGCPRVMLTQGKYGCHSYSAAEGFRQVPAFATQVVDRVGAGDAVFSLTALCVAQGAPAELVGFLGNVVGAEAVTILGNQRSIERIPLYRQVECLLKMHNTATGAEPKKEKGKFAA
jgi:bifunctional ADP-heptose synthase (sugar kinase/adenylyltransferase)